jgi:arabinofuranosyltransferase
MKTGTIDAVSKILGFVVVAMFGALRAWDLRFVQDDAYISWRYADNLARGLGLVWNEGEHVEGYTNFLWTVIVAIPHALGLDVELFVTLLGLALFTATLAMFYALVGALTRSWVAAAAATLTLGLFPSFAAYATGGLETQLQACFVIAMVTLVVSGIQRECPSALISAAIGTTGALAILTRMDSIVIVAPLITLHAWSIAAYGSRRLPAVALAVGVPLAICGGWLAWKFVYYGSLLPNTYRTKVEGIGGLTREGMRFGRTFLQAYAFYLPVACVPIGGWLAWEGRLDRRVIVVVAVPLVFWIAYVVRVGGDFMEYRLLIPALPLVFLATYWVMCELDAQPARAALLTSIVLAGGMWSYASAQVPKPAGSPLPLEEIALRREWFEIGTVLHEAFAHSVQPKIAVVPAGVIPYLSRLPSVDMLGLNDPDVRHFLYLRDQMIGHRRLAPLDLLERRHVHFLIAHPVVRARLAPTMRYGFADFAQRPFAYADEYRLKGRQVIEVPLPGARVMLMVYLTEDLVVTARIDQVGWRHYRLD